MKHLIVILLLLTITVHSSNPSDQQQQQSQFFSPLSWTNSKNNRFYSNLFSQYKQINITSKLIIKPPLQKQKTITSQSTTLILEQDYLNMYKNKLGYRLKFNLTDELYHAIENNHTFVQTAFYFIEAGKNYLIEKQSIPLLGEFKHDWREGIEHFVLADLQLCQQQKPQKMMLKQMDVYFFQIDQQLPFQNDFQGSLTFGLVQVQLRNSKPADYYYPRPLATKINTQLKENYIPLPSQHQTSSSLAEIKVNLKIGSHLFPLMMHMFESYHDTTSQMMFEIDGMEFEIGKSMEAAGPFIIRYFKKVLFEGSFIGWVYLLIQTFITLCSKMTSFIAILFEIQIFKNPIKYRGMSLYSILVFIWIDILLIVLSYGYLRTGDFLGPLVSLVIGVWKIKKMARVEFFWEYPFVEIVGSPWYESYSEKDKRSLFETWLPSTLIVALVVVYPLAFQGYLGSEISTEQSLIKYLLHRFTLAINEYRFILAILPQIFLNQKLKTCNSLPWKLLIVLVWFYSVDNLLVPVSTSLWEVLFYLKQEILLAVLIGQKIIYGDNLEMLPVVEQKKEQKESKYQNKQEKDANDDREKNDKGTQNEKVYQKQEISVESTGQINEIEEKSKQE